MSDELLPYYNRELAYFRRLAADFARTNPKIAGRLRLSAEASEDPHVERLIEAFAYMNAHIRHKLDDDFPELTDALLSVLYPHCLAPIPSMAIVQLVFDEKQSDLTAGYSVAQGSPIDTEAIDGEPCRFRTCYDVPLWPLRIASAALDGLPLRAPATPHSADAQAAIRIRLQCLSDEISFGSVEAESLRFYLHGLRQHTYLLYELIFNNCIEVAIASGPDDRNPIVMDPQCLRTVGFGSEEGMLPASPHSTLGHRLLTEFFAFPDKFLFFDLTLPDREALARLKDTAQLYIYLDRTSVDLEQNVSDDTFRLGCTPVVNLFRQRAEPIQLTQTETQYRVVPDARRPMAAEVYWVEDVVAHSPAGEEFDYLPFYSVNHATQGDQRQKFWYAARQAAEPVEGEVDHGTEVFLNLVDLDFTPSPEADWYVDVGTLCLNRDLPNRLPFGGGQPRLALSEGGGPVSRVLCLTAPTPTRRPPRGNGARWRLISNLSIGHQSLVEGPAGAKALREILKLYDFRDAADTRAMIEGVLSVNSRRVVGRVPGQRAPGVCRGVEVEVHFDADRFSENSMFLFACVLEHFLGNYCSINSFTKLIARAKGRDGILRAWPPRAGDLVLV